jgi:hypothetical protein
LTHTLALASFDQNDSVAPWRKQAPPTRAPLQATKHLTNFNVYCFTVLRLTVSVARSTSIINPNATSNKFQQYPEVEYNYNQQFTSTRRVSFISRMSYRMHTDRQPIISIQIYIIHDQCIVFIYDLLLPYTTCITVCAVFQS